MAKHIHIFDHRVQTSDKMFRLHDMDGVDWGTWNASNLEDALRQLRADVARRPGAYMGRPNEESIRKAVRMGGADKKTVDLAVGQTVKFKTYASSSAPTISGTVTHLPSPGVDPKNARIQVKGEDGRTYMLTGRDLVHDAGGWFEQDMKRIAKEFVLEGRTEGDFISYIATRWKASAAEQQVARQVFQSWKRELGK